MKDKKFDPKQNTDISKMSLCVDHAENPSRDDLSESQIFEASL
jgi:hypothetical protein